MFLSNLKRVVILLLLSSVGIGAGVYQALADRPTAAADKPARAATPGKPDAGAGTRAAPLAQVDRAIQALGGADRLNRLLKSRIKAKVTTTLNDQNFEFTLTGAFEAFDRIRLGLDEFKGGVKRPSGELLFIFNGDRIWQQFGKNARELQGPGKEMAASFGQESYALRLAQTLAPLTDRAYELSPVGEVKIDDRVAVGIRASHKDCPDVNLYFDKARGLPVKCELRLKGFSGQLDAFEEKAFELLLSDYKETDGRKQFTKVVIKADGKNVMQLELTEVAPQEQLDADTFTPSK